MTDSLHLSKFHGLGNDFLVRLRGPRDLALDSGQAVSLCNRTRGFGADGLIDCLVQEGVDPIMTLFNSDGSRAEMSGNGLRCLSFALTLHDTSLTSGLWVSTDAGERDVKLLRSDGYSADIETSMSSGRVVGERVVAGFRGVVVDVGNPHFVIFSEPNSGDDWLKSLDLSVLGPDLESNFPGGINIEWAVVKDQESVAMRVWERGVGITQACGTGSCAVFLAGYSGGNLLDSAKIANPGGILTVSIKEGVLYLGGPAVYVGDIELTWLQLKELGAGL